CRAKLGIDRRKQPGLSTVAEMIGVETAEEEMHRAVQDCRVSLDCLRKLWDKELFDELRVPADDEFVKKLTFKPAVICDPNNPLVDRSKFEVGCPACEARMEQVTEPKPRGKGFSMKYSCPGCGRDYLVKHMFRLKYEGMEYKRSFKEIVTTNNLQGDAASDMEKKTVAIIFGGRSSEHEVSRTSATMVINNIDRGYLSSKETLIRGAKAIVIDPSLTEDSLDYLLDTYKDKMIFADPVSDVYAAKIRPYIDRIYAIKPNLSELRILSEREINNEEDLIAAGKSLIGRGLKKLLVSLGKDGCLYMDEDRIEKMKFCPVEDVVNASGAGDAFFAAAIYGIVQGADVREAIKYGLAAGILTIRSAQTISPELNINTLREIIKENENENA
ncbi:MAG: bifunctional hydroxymethylpyrimidine kinase/phosphomethylpyrimidine kinase, partial [Erysipelotrichaceae bacterium]|nr:bifunctional hydroxymethylpyrimidine kinase/phosphomethylpyrimidine kinase [Erysipelotrichaceae bacterium]